MGYGTLQGDTCGGVEPIGDFYKSDLFELAKWRNSITKVLPDDVINRAPSAKLSEGQKDEDSLPPYKILDAILRFYLDDNLSKNQIISLGFDEEIVNFVFNQYEKMTFKRLQMPPSFLMVREKQTQMVVFCQCDANRV